ncbi:hypothetical protein FHS42_000689 [Streptomyces zagrosensis]|uniref:Uncharacterized protein n=1 Tax=Streptomyces zagrosensis TaxID=1042984 RepID=A0A7W9Q4X2_9ACTN|nr:hypothetical protein [Streptomyces zagrosensis]
MGPQTGEGAGIWEWLGGDRRDQGIEKKDGRHPM